VRGAGVRLTFTYAKDNNSVGLSNMTELMSDAVNLMIVGMGFVFVFLTILVFVTSLMSKMVQKYAPEPEKKASLAAPIAATASNDAQLLAVLSAAVAKYRSDQKK
jgi:oxaloacetate decarboxylase gamma subunit